jgi:hypothetical protein
MESRIAEADIYQYFQAEFQPIYADLVVVLGEKPSQITLQIDAAFSHMAVAHSHPEARELNLQRALGHLQRAALDAAKLLWLHKKRELSALVEDADIRRFCTNHPESELLRKYREAERLAIEARRLEVEGVGISPAAAVSKYYDAAIAFTEALDLFDPDKLAGFRRFRIGYMLRKHAVGFVVGAVSGVVGTLLAALIF